MYSLRSVLTAAACFPAVTAFGAGPFKKLLCRNQATQSVFEILLAATDYDDFSRGAGQFTIHRNLLKALAAQGSKSFRFHDVGNYAWDAQGFRFNFRNDAFRHNFTVTQTREGLSLSYHDASMSGGGNGKPSHFLFNRGECWIDEKPL